MEKLKKSVKIGSTVYQVTITDNEISASETVYPLSGYGNNYGTEWVISLTASKRWARVATKGWNNTYATRGHGLTDSWTISQSYMPKAEAEKLKDDVTKALAEAEDGTPDVKAVFQQIKDAVTRVVDED